MRKTKRTASKGSPPELVSRCRGSTDRCRTYRKHLHRLQQRLRERLPIRFVGVIAVTDADVVLQLCVSKGNSRRGHPPTWYLVSSVFVTPVTNIMATSMETVHFAAMLSSRLARTKERGRPDKMLSYGPSGLVRDTPTPPCRYAYISLKGTPCMVAAREAWRAEGDIVRKHELDAAIADLTLP